MVNLLFIGLLECITSFLVYFDFWESGFIKVLRDTVPMAMAIESLEAKLLDSLKHRCGGCFSFRKIFIGWGNVALASRHANETNDSYNNSIRQQEIQYEIANLMLRS